MNKPLEPETVLTFGKFKGEELQNVDAEYLEYLYRSGVKFSPRAMELLGDGDDEASNMWDGVIGLEYGA